MEGTSLVLAIHFSPCFLQSRILFFAHFKPDAFSLQAFPPYFLWSRMLILFLKMHFSHHFKNNSTYCLSKKTWKGKPSMTCGVISYCPWQTLNNMETGFKNWFYLKVVDLYKSYYIYIVNTAKTTTQIMLWLANSTPQVKWQMKLIKVPRSSKLWAVSLVNLTMLKLFILLLLLASSKGNEVKAIDKLIAKLQDVMKLPKPCELFIFEKGTSTCTVGNVFDWRLTD